MNLVAHLSINGNTFYRNQFIIVSEYVGLWWP